MVFQNDEILFQTSSEVGPGQLVRVVQGDAPEVVVRPQLHDAVHVAEGLGSRAVAVLGDDFHHRTSEERLTVSRDVRAGHLAYHVGHSLE